jgi:hypothetical protein
MRSKHSISKRRQTSGARTACIAKLAKKPIEVYNTIHAMILARSTVGALGYAV